MKFKKAFTIVELLFVVIIVSLLIPLVIEIYGSIQKQKQEIDVKQQLLFQGYELLEKMNILMQNYTIDYEEYFNRTMVGCSSNERWIDFVWNVNSSGYCTNFTTYGNGNPIDPSRPWYHKLYYLSRNNTSIGNYYSTKYRTDLKKWSQSFGQYQWIFYDVKNDTDIDGELYGDSDDEDLWRVKISWLDAIQHSTWVQELYLISLDGKERLFFRRKLVDQQHFTGLSIDNTRPYTTWEQLYTIQMLRLKGFDAGTKHTFDDTIGTSNPGIYDGYIDTRACDVSQWFIGHGQPVGGVYSGYYLPNSSDDCWVDFPPSTISLQTWNFSLYPTHNPKYAWALSGYQIHPYIGIYTYHVVYLPAWKKLFYNEIADFFLPLKTTLNIKSTYFWW